MEHHHHNYHDHKHGSAWITAAHATLHCLTGCIIGEVFGLVIGVSLGLSVSMTITLTFILAFFFGFLLGILPIMKREKVTAYTAFKIIWLGEAISIFVMEVVMNMVDYHIGGMQVPSIIAPRFWLAIGLAIPAGFLAAWPLNYWLLKMQIKKGHC